MVYMCNDAEVTHPLGRNTVEKAVIHQLKDVSMMLRKTRRRRRGGGGGGRRRRRRRRKVGGGGGGDGGGGGGDSGDSAGREKPECMASISEEDTRPATKDFHDLLT